MKTTAYLAAIWFLTSCSPYPKGLHDDCRTYLKEFRAQWKRLPNGFYSCIELAEKRKSPFYTNGDLLVNDWEKHLDCLSKLSPCEVKRLFGEPSNVQHAFNEVKNINILNYFYIISDTKCNPQMVMPFNMGAYNNNILWFAFFNGKQVDKNKPRLSLPCE
jgi:hypothetical protein